MKLSKRADSIQPSITLAITAKFKEMKAQGVDVVGFGAGEPDFDTPDNIKQAAVQAIADGKTKYTPASGTNDLKKAIQAKLKRDNNLDYTLNQISVNCGAKHSLYNIFQAIIDDGDEVIISAPYWVSYPAMVTLAGGTPVIIESEEENDFELDLSDLEKAVTDKTRAIIINSPANPTGALYTTEKLKAIAGFIKDKDIYIVSDDIYEHMVYEGEFNNIATLAPEIKEKTIVVNGVSKAYAMTGWRIGYVAGPENVIKAINKIQSQSTSNPTSIAQVAAVEALNGDQSSIQTMVAAFNERRDYIVKALNEIEGVICFKPQGAFYVFPNISAFYGKKYDDAEIKGSLDFANLLLEKAKVAVVPGIGFGADDYVRLSYASSLENIQKGIERIKEFVAALN